MPPTHLLAALEALLFSSDQPLTLALMSEALEIPAEQLFPVLHQLAYEKIEARLREGELGDEILFA